MGMLILTEDEDCVPMTQQKQLHSFRKVRPKAIVLKKKHKEVGQTDFRKTHLFQNLISQDPEHEILLEDCLALMCSWSYQNHEHE